jgi:hypothetical protein
MSEPTVDDVVAVVYPQTGALRIFATQSLAKMHVAPTELARYGMRSALDMKRSYAHDKLETIWRKLHEHMVWGMPRTAVGPAPQESELTPPDCGTDLLADELWALMLRVGDRVTEAATIQRADRSQYHVRRDKIALILDDEEALKAYPRQCKLILTALYELKDEFVHEDKIKRMMTELALYGGLKTKQDPFLIWQYYRVQLVKDGLVSRGGDTNDEEDV